MSTQKSIKSDLLEMEFELSGQAASEALKVLEKSWSSANFSHADLLSMLSDIDSTIGFIANFRERLIRASEHDNPLMESTFCAADFDLGQSAANFKWVCVSRDGS